ncbi:MAG: hypothetical protein RSE41_11070 [Clostridia bacterium]
MKDVRERISSSINLYLSKANVHRDESLLLVEYIEKKFIKVDSNYYINTGVAEEIHVSDEDMEWTVETFLERLYKRSCEEPTNSYRYVSAKIVDLSAYRELKNNR